MRVGIGYDAHRFATNRRLMLGGVEIPSDRGLEGHSDADVVLHALADAILGAAGCGDIGEHFPPDDDTWRDADSADLLIRTLEIVDTGWRVVNADIVVIAEAPRIAPHREAIRERISQLIGVDRSAVNVKATTNERMGFIGRGEGIAAMATVSLTSNDA
jgi:2-C-methyl-D-erythritol 2,4-cyclodiphosphate synthase